MPITNYSGKKKKTTKNPHQTWKKKKKNHRNWEKSLGMRSCEVVQDQHPDQK